MKQVRTYETEKAAHEKTRLERNEERRLKERALGTVRGLEAKVKRLEAERDEAQEKHVTVWRRKERLRERLAEVAGGLRGAVGDREGRIMNDDDKKMLEEIDALAAAATPRKSWAPAEWVVRAHVLLPKLVACFRELDREREGLFDRETTRAVCCDENERALDKAVAEIITLGRRLGLHPLESASCIDLVLGDPPSR